VEGRSDLNPVDTDTPGTSGNDIKTTRSLTFEPLQRHLFISQVGFELLQALAIVILHPLLLPLAEHTILDHLGLDRDTCESLEAEPALAVIFVFRPNSSHDEGGFDTDTPLAGKV